MDAPLAAWPWDNLGMFKVCLMCVFWNCFQIVAFLFFFFLPLISTNAFDFFSPFWFNSKYVLYGPLVGKALYSWVYEDKRIEYWCLHILIISVLRGLIHILWNSFSNMLFLNRTRQINQRGVDFKQIDNEWNWY